MYVSNSEPLYSLQRAYLVLIVVVGYHLTRPIFASWMCEAFECIFVVCEHFLRSEV